MHRPGGLRQDRILAGRTGLEVDGEFIARPPGKTIPIVNIIGITTKSPIPASSSSSAMAGRSAWRRWTKAVAGLFLIYADRTSGHGSYGAGRYLDAPKPDASGRVVLDFNRGYNPPCAFTAFATCPLPPPENRLDLAIAAGEKAYVKAAQ